MEESSGASGRERIILPCEALCLSADRQALSRPVRGRSEEERGAQENSFLIHWSNPYSLSLVPLESFDPI